MCNGVDLRRIVPIRINFHRYEIHTLDLTISPLIVNNLFTPRQFQRLRTISTLVLKYPTAGWWQFTLLSFLEKMVDYPELRELRIVDVDVSCLRMTPTSIPTVLHLDIRTSSYYKSEFLTTILSADPQFLTLRWFNAQSYCWGIPSPWTPSSMPPFNHNLKKLDVVLGDIEPLFCISSTLILPRLRTLAVTARYDGSEQLRREIARLFPLNIDCIVAIAYSDQCWWE